MIPDFLSIVLVLGFAVFVALVSFRFGPRRREWWPARPAAGSPPPWCQCCGYSVHGIPPEVGRCPECGEEFAGDTLRLRLLRRVRFRLLLTSGVIAASLLAFTLWFVLPGYECLTTDHTLRGPRSEMILLERDWSPDLNAPAPYGRFWFTAPRHAWSGPFGVPWSDVQPAIPSWFVIDSWATSGRNLFITIEPNDAAYSTATPTGAQRIERPFDAEALLSVMEQAGIETRLPEVREEVEFAIRYRRSVFDRQPRHEGGPFKECRGHLPVGSIGHKCQPWWLTLPPTLVAAALWLLYAKRILRQTANLHASVGMPAAASTD